MDLKTTLCGIELDNPLMPGSGPISGDSDRLLVLDGMGIGGLVTKTIAVAAAEVVRPCIVKKDGVIFNCEAWSEYDADRWIEDFLPRTAKAVTRPILASVGYGPEDYEYIIPKIDHMVSGYECVARFHSNRTDYDELSESIQTFARLTTKPFWVKMSANRADIVGFARTCFENGAAGVVAITSLGPCLAVDVRRREPLIGLESGFSWASGPVIKPVALSTVFQIKQAIPEISIIGSGGVASAEDVLEFLLCGADAVEMLSAAMMRGRSLYKKIVGDLPKTLKKFGFSSIDEVRRTGLTNPPTVFEPSHPVVGDDCTGCTLCAINCPYDAMKMVDHKAVPDLDKCFGCGLCESICPVKCISNVLRK